MADNIFSLGEVLPDEYVSPAAEGAGTLGISCRYYGQQTGGQTCGFGEWTVGGICEGLGMNTSEYCW